MCAFAARRSTTSLGSVFTAASATAASGAANGASARRTRRAARGRAQMAAALCALCAPRAFARGMSRCRPRTPTGATLASGASAPSSRSARWVYTPATVTAASGAASGASANGKRRAARNQVRVDQAPYALRAAHAIETVIPALFCLTPSATSYATRAGGHLNPSPASAPIGATASLAPRLPNQGHEALAIFGLCGKQVDKVRDR
jgi:hypothetical protein